MQIGVIVLSFSCAVSSLALTAAIARPAPPQAEERRSPAAKQSSSGAEVKEMTTTKKIVTEPEVEPFESSQRGFNGLGKRFLVDQVHIWTSPGKIRFSDTPWLVPLTGVTAGLFVTDSDFSKHLSQNPTTISHYRTLSNAGIGALIGGAGGMWLLGHVRHNEHWSETGFLAGEAALNSLVAVEAFKYSLRRDRPYQGNGSGSFFQGGGTSFPSEHAAAAWSVAGVIAHEYPSPFMKVMAYGLASLVDYSRIRGRQHFPSDVFVGSVIGNLVAEDVYNRHHDTELGGSSWDPFPSFLRQTRASSSANMGSPYVPLDSWIYPALDRLIAQGFVRSAIVDMRPWTRFECARLVTEAGEQLEEVDASSSQAAKIYHALAEEFREDRELMGGGENYRARMESAYTRLTGISGAPLSQGYHYDLGQTVINDFGRPNEQGFNDVTGFSGWATESRFTVYARGEFQHAPGAPPLTPSARQVIGQTQEVPTPPATPIGQVDRFRLLDTYVGMTLENWQVTFGKQSLWWGPGAGGPMVFSDNAAPINMFRVNRVSPFKLPSVFGLMGPIRVEFFLGQLSGQNFIFGESTGLLGSWTSSLSPQPMISGERFSFKPTPNVELGFALTTLFAGQGVPFTLHTYLKSMAGSGNANPGTPQDPGDRRSGFDLSYRLPLLRDWVTFYADGFADDQFSPVAFWDRSAWTGGLYLSHLPKVPKLDLRLEGVYTDLPIGGAVGHGFFYWNDRYHSGYTNQGNLIGSWIGRQGQGAQAWSNYWFTPKNRLQLNFRHEKVSQQFVPGGGSLTDVGAQGSYSPHKSLELSLSVQYERWLVPAIQPRSSQNVTTSFMLRFVPGRALYPGSHSDVSPIGAFAGAEDAGGRP